MPLLTDGEAYAEGMDLTNIALLMSSAPLAWKNLQLSYNLSCYLSSE